MKRSSAVLLFALAALSAPSLAKSPWYAGVGAGLATTSKDLVTNRESTITLGSNFSTAFDDRDKSWKALVGYRFNPIVGVELNYADLGAHRTETSLLGGDPPQPAAIAIDRDIAGFGADLVFRVPVGERLELLARAGVVRARLKAKATLTGNIVFTGADPAERARSTTQNETVMRYGFGGQWALGDNASLRVEWERYAEVGKAFAIGATGTTGEADTDVVSVGLILRF